MSKQGFLVKQGRLILLSIIAFSSFALADLNFKGFATMTGGATLSDDDNLHGYDDDFLFEQNSFLGIQANADLGEGLTAVAQIVSRGSDSWNPKFEWAYIGYEVNDSLKILAGRQRLPLFVYSDYLDVSYAYHWISPPEATYSLPFNSVTGAGALITSDIGNASSTLHIVVGRSTEDINVQGVAVPSDASNLVSTAWTVEYDSLIFRAGYSIADLNLGITALEPLAAGWAQAGVEFSDATSNPAYASEWSEYTNYILGNDGNESGTFGGIGVTYDNGDFIAIAEYNKLTTQGTVMLKEEDGYYFSLAKRFGSLMPHITYGTKETIAPSTSFMAGANGPLALAAQLGLDPNIANPYSSVYEDPSETTNPYYGLAGLIVNTLGAFNAPAAEIDYLIIGLRWDFHPSAAFKVDLKSQDNTLPTDDTNRLLRFSIVTVF